MLVLTDNATSAIRELVTRPEIPDGAGIRIMTTTDEDRQSPNLRLSAALSPEPGDEVVETGGARVFLESAAAQLLENEVLDAEVDQQGGVRFLVAHQ